MGSDATPGGFGGQRISRTLEQIRIGCPGCVKETKSGGDRTLSKNNEQKFQQVAENVLKMV